MYPTYDIIISVTILARANCWLPWPPRGRLPRNFLWAGKLGHRGRFAPPALRMHHAVPEVATHNAAICAASSTGGPTYLTSDAVPRHCAECDQLQCALRCMRQGSVAPTGITTLTSGAAPCHRAGGASGTSRPYILQTMQHQAIVQTMRWSEALASFG